MRGARSSLLDTAAAAAAGGTRESRRALQGDWRHYLDIFYAFGRILLW